MKLKGRYIPDREFYEEPKGINEMDAGNGLTELTHSELSVICFAPRREPARKKKSPIRDLLIVGSVFVPFTTWVCLADFLVLFPAVFFGTLAAAVGWPAIVVYANMKDT